MSFERDLEYAYKKWDVKGESVDVLVSDLLRVVDMWCQRRPTSLDGLPILIGYTVYDNVGNPFCVTHLDGNKVYCGEYFVDTAENLTIEHYDDIEY